ncbi:ribonuclease [Sphingomonas crocodyli]|uniref:Ribonuclease n=1 Tax=Sphingomonas crocodyli TaxID=1979270 RepID=A0A437LZM1_9SPHN|nr:ribonuclease [Sphingomonas crocodyli]RVT90852.1 ribonuclease [Sphingomonas crocodyli]
MAEWLYEAGIGEARAALVDNDIIIQAAIEADDDGLRAGTIAPARLTRITAPGRRGIVTLDDGTEAMIEPLPRGVTEGGRLLVEIARAAIAEPGRGKLAIARAAAADAVVAPGRDLRARIAADNVLVRELTSFGPDRLEAAGWSELIEEASSGHADFDGGALRLSLTPAMTLIDVDGWLPIADLAVAGAGAAAMMIRRHDIGGSIGIDLPTVEGKAARLSAAEAVDAILPQPFDRTAVNGFGFLQIVRRRARLSIPERLQQDPVGSAARALIRRAERAQGIGPRTLTAAPAVIAAIERRPDWIAELERRIGAPVRLRGEPGLAISAGHAEAQNP